MARWREALYTSAPLRPLMSFDTLRMSGRPSGPLIDEPVEPFERAQVGASHHTGGSTGLTWEGVAARLFPLNGGSPGDGERHAVSRIDRSTGPK